VIFFDFFLMTITQHALLYNLHTSNFIFEEMFLLKFLSMQPLIAYNQLKDFTLYLEDKPAQLAAYHEFLVSIYSFLHDTLLS